MCAHLSDSWCFVEDFFPPRVSNCIYTLSFAWGEFNLSQSKSAHLSLNIARRSSSAYQIRRKCALLLHHFIYSHVIYSCGALCSNLTFSLITSCIELFGVCDCSESSTVSFTCLFCNNHCNRWNMYLGIIFTTSHKDQGSFNIWIFEMSSRTDKSFSSEQEKFAILSVYLASPLRQHDSDSFPWAENNPRKITLSRVAMV